MSDAVGDSIEIQAAPEVVWSLVSDVDRMPDWSPELFRVRWLGAATGPVVGARFRGTNRNGARRWSTTCTITRAEPAKCFAFEVSSLFGLPVSEWRYEIEETSTGSRLTESTVDKRGWLIRSLGGVATGVRQRKPHNLDGIRRTLATIKAAAESTGTTAATG